MNGEIIAIGDELTSGRILNTTSSFAAGHLFAAGHEVIAMATIGDDPELIEAALKKALARADFLIVTGGLGATSDDVTNETVAKVLGLPRVFYPDILKKITGEEYGAAPPPTAAHPLEKLAWLPAGARVLKPDARMAGHLLVHDGKPIFFLPGVPFEMKELMVDCVLPYLAGASTRRVRQKIYRIFGLQETAINRTLRHLEENDPYVRLGYYPVFPEVHVSLSVLGDDPAAMERQFRKYDIDIIALLGANVYGAGQDTMEAVVGRLLGRRGLTLAVAESCSGGLVAHRLTRVPGSSGYFLGGVVAYSNSLKERLLGVPAATLKRHGAVSLETARAMAEGVRAATGADLAVSVTGIAGPDGGTKTKPVGTVCFGLATAAGTRDAVHHFKGDRWQVQEIAGETALDMVRRHLVKGMETRED